MYFSAVVITNRYRFLSWLIRMVIKWTINGNESEHVSNAVFTTSGKISSSRFRNLLQLIWTDMNSMLYGDSFGFLIFLAEAEQRQLRRGTMFVRTMQEHQPVIACCGGESTVASLRHVFTTFYSILTSARPKPLLAFLCYCRQAYGNTLQTVVGNMLCCTISTLLQQPKEPPINV